ncbi:MAG: amidohydrolase family protein [Rhodospirillales bacterium]|jgi:aminocarboxymuconate-semialdehyde decarboxylase|nr:amidohydrolase family protein [Rhodospirillales bacterium]MDP6645021.1 amidohydrolase family protein [Rhodospirillales bacterium]MDP6843599.1 amidohydrolase family protein [Rhodospirillales bacterium]|tara:strand:- start:543 stop:1496 length:954 start_codon:yes stop_codon:yes gene_type:complete
MKIDIYTHWWPKRAAQLLLEKAGKSTDPVAIKYLEKRESKTAVNDLDLRFRFMDRHPDVLHVLTISNPPVEMFAGPEDSAEISRIANDELAELVATYPDRFIGGVAILPMNDIDLALAECERAIGELGLKGVRLYTNILGEKLDAERLRPLYAKMAAYNLPIWLHPTEPPSVSVGEDSMLGWEFETSKAMLTIASSWIFDEFPELKFITHHLGSMIPYFEQRIRWMAPEPKTHANLRRFHNDTALYGCTAALMCGYEFFGADHILFGTDMPLGSMRLKNSAGFMETTLRAVEAMDIPAAEKQKIYLENAVNLLRLAV